MVYIPRKHFWNPTEVIRKAYVILLKLIFTYSTEIFRDDILMQTGTISTMDNSFLGYTENVKVNIILDNWA